MLNYNTTNNAINQDSIADSFDLHFISCDYFKSLSKATKIILDNLLAMAYTYSSVHPCQRTLGAAAAVTRQTANEIVGRLCNDKIFTKNYRHFRSSTYDLNPALYTPSIRLELKNILTQANILPLTRQALTLREENDKATSSGPISTEEYLPATIKKSNPLSRFNFDNPTQIKLNINIRELRWAQYTAQRPRVGVPPPPLGSTGSRNSQNGTAGEKEIYGELFWKSYFMEPALPQENIAQSVAFKEFESLSNTITPIKPTGSDNSSVRFRCLRRQRANRRIEEIFKSRSVSVPLAELHPQENSMSTIENIIPPPTVSLPAVPSEAVGEAQPPVLVTLGKQLRLTEWGILRLSAFPEEALLYSSDKLKYSKNIRDKFAFVVKLCSDYCRDNGLKPNWQHIDQRKKELNMPLDAPMTRVVIEQEPADASSMKQTHAQIQRQYQEMRARTEEREKEKHAKRNALENQRNRETFANPIATITEWFLFEEKRNNSIKTFSYGIMALPKVVEELRAGENPYGLKAQEYCRAYDIDLKSLPSTYNELVTFLNEVVTQASSRTTPGTAKCHGLK